MIGGTEIRRRFSMHQVDDETAAKLEQVRAGFSALASVIDGLAPDSREKSLAFTKMEEGMLWANSAIARPADAA